MLEKTTKRIEVTANLAVILVACLASALLLRELSRRGQPPTPLSRRAANESPQPYRSPAPAPGTAVSLQGVNWTAKPRTVVLVLSTKCRFCTDSAPFYRRLIEEAGRRRLGVVAVLPQDPAEANSYLLSIGVGVDSVVQAPPMSVGASGTPTLLFVSPKGTVEGIWIGRLGPDGEAEVLRRLTSPVSE